MDKKYKSDSDLFNKLKKLKANLDKDNQNYGDRENKIIINGLEMDERFFNGEELEKYLNSYVESPRDESADTNFGSNIDKTIEGIIDQYLRGYLIKTYGKSGSNNKIFAALATQSDEEVNRIMNSVNNIKQEIQGIGRDNQSINEVIFNKFMLKIDFHDYMIEKIHEYAIRMYVDKLSSHTVTRDVEYNRLSAQSHHKEYSETIAEVRDNLRELNIDLDYTPSIESYLKPKKVNKSTKLKKINSEHNFDLGLKDKNITFTDEDIFSK